MIRLKKRAPSIAPMMNLQKARLMAISLSGSYMVIHTMLFFFFRRYGVTPMMVFNIFSVVFYAVLFVTSISGFNRFFPIAVYLEVVLHMTAATYFTGWDSGFQITLLAMCVLSAYADYLGRSMKIYRYRATPLCLLGMALYIGLCEITYHRPVRYPLPRDVNHMMQLFWGFIVFSISIAFLSVFVRITVRSEAYLADQAGRDRLTGLPNRYFMMDHLAAIQSCSDLNDHWVAMIDIDDFKLVNDNYGHNCGDAVLIQLSQLLMESADGFTACRWGGEEFLLVGQIREDVAARVQQVDDLRRRVMDRLFTYGNTQLHLTITVGFAEYRDGWSIEAWIEAADQRLYTGKKNGKNRVVA